MKFSIVILTILFISVFHRAIILITFAPFVAIVYKIKTHNNGKFPTKKNIITKGIIYIYRKNAALLDELFLRWTGEIHSHRIRNFIYRHIYKMRLGEKATIYADCEIRNIAQLSIGKGSIIGDNAILDARAGINIKENVCLASNVSIWTYQHDYRDPYFRCNEGHFGPVTIENRAWIGPNTIILHDVVIGEGAVVAAGSVVTKNVPPFSLVAGIPAKVIGERPKDLRYEFDGTHRHYL